MKILIGAEPNFANSNIAEVMTMRPGVFMDVSFKGKGEETDAWQMNRIAVLQFLSQFCFQCR